ncbi:MAG: pantoate--beta-alanine ligase [Spirochaetes bacterium]|jgi:pantoate--beta-alanine ligase|nr:pantoate--beta-alanine ligase [Spirochaetota bacterium]
MKTAHTIEEVRSIIRAARAEGRGIGFVPTMGYLHRGHTSLVEESRKKTGFQVMSIFVNKMQFNDPKDFSNYPRDLERDLSIAREAGVDLVFVPTDEVMYRDQRTCVDVDLLTDHLCGAHRPGHFRGVFTVVGKLFNIVLPDIAVFGQKDIQQAVGLEKMVADLNFPLKIVIAPTVREDDGLAMSSRNRHLNADERHRALCIHRSLKKAAEMIASGERSASNISEAVGRVLAEGSPDKIDYVSVVRYGDLQPVDGISPKSVLAIAAFFGSTRLIDNMIMEERDEKFACIY